MSEFFYWVIERRADRVDQILASTNLTEMADDDEYYPLFLANGLTCLGRREEAIRWLGRAVDYGFTNHIFLSDKNRFLEPLRGDPGFEDVLRRAREKEALFEV
jgi:hypothetical protein